MFVKTIQRLAILFIVFCSAVLIARRDRISPKPVSFYRTAAEGKTMGTFWSVKVYAPKEGFEKDLRETVQKELDRIDGMMSTYKSDSELSKFNKSQSTDWFPVSKDLAEVFSCALDVSRKTNGAFDITVGPLVNIWKFGPDKSPLKEFPSLGLINEIRKRVGSNNLEVRLEPDPAIRKKIPSIYADLSAVAKGYSVDSVARVLEQTGIFDYMIEVGGEIRCSGSKYSEKGNEPWVLGIERPKISNGIEQPLHRTVVMNNQSMATSGDYRNYRQIRDVRFSHIIDPRTGRPTEIISKEEEQTGIYLGSVSVIMNTCVEADAWATAFFVLGPEEGLTIADRENIAVLFVSRKGISAGTKLLEVSSGAFQKNIRSEFAD